jgi:hypothetical protein
VLTKVKQEHNLRCTLLYARLRHLPIKYSHHHKLKERASQAPQTRYHSLPKTLSLDVTVLAVPPKKRPTPPIAALTGRMGAESNT